MDTDFANKFWDLTGKSKSIVISSHLSPDDDSISSVLSVYRLLVKKYPDKKIRIVYSGRPVDRYTTFADYDQVEFVEDMADRLEDCDLLIVLDGSQYTRFSRKLTNFSGNSICIDHHASPPSEFTASLIQPEAIATSELIYENFYKDQEIDQKTAEILLLGLLGDSGDFTYLKPQNSSVFDMAKKLLEILNVEVQEFKSRYSTISLRVFEIIKEFMKNTQFQEVTGWPKFMTTFLSREFKSTNDYTDSEISDASNIYVSNYLLQIKDHTWGFAISPKSDGRCSYSCRSLPGSVNVRIFMESTVKGGGHDRAAGGTVNPVDDKEVNPEESLQKILDWMKTSKPVLS